MKDTKQSTSYYTSINLEWSRYAIQKSELTIKNACKKTDTMFAGNSQVKLDLKEDWISQTEIWNQSMLTY